MTHIICFGDSITRGENDSEKGGWTDRLKAYCMKLFLKNKKDEICVFNMGIGGETTEGLIKRFTNEFNTRLLKDENNIVTLAYGANDIALLNGNNTVSLEKFSSNLNFCIDYALKQKTTVYLINILPVIEDDNNTKKRSLKDISRYNDVLLSIAQKQNINLIDIYSKFEITKENLLTYDGVHPNAEGHEKIFNIIKESILPNHD
ncbi:SGNH/GDSL hydrolase family protein [Tenacibaculum sp. SDUM215027]|uniref:SGNH/GDSL hydrolase family protein n=1 Tax=Tenacibaculum sp. SDUM215027 TaxID=3422596 RepID=UPI003D321A54